MGWLAKFRKRLRKREQVEEARRKHEWLEDLCYDELQPEQPKQREPQEPSEGGKIELPSWEVIPIGTPHPIHGKKQRSEGAWIRHHKGHDVTRPYFKYSTSKWDLSIIDVYEVLLDQFKHEVVRILEIGVYYGESLRYFREYFTHPDTRIVGIDNTDYKGIGAKELHNVFLETADQRDLDEIVTIGARHGHFEVIIDDASHDAEIAESCLRELWPFLREGGLYLIEDIDPGAVAHLLDEVVLTHEGKGFKSSARGFGPCASAGGITVFRKTKDTITGLEI